VNGGRKRKLHAIALALLWFCLDVPVTGAEEIQIGITGNGVSTLSLRMAEAGGFFKREGLNVQVVNIEGGTRGLQVLLSGHVQGISSGLAPLVQANRGGADARMIAATWNSIPFTVFSLPSVKTGADLKGGTIGVSTFGSEPDIAVALGLKRLGLSRKDVTVVQMGENSKRLNALLAGYVTAVPLAEPAVTIARERGLHALIDLTGVNVPSGIVVARDYLESQRSVLTRLVRAAVESTYFGLTHDKDARELIAAVFKINRAKAIDSTYNEFRRLVPRDFEISREGAENVIEQLQAIGIKVGSKNLADHIDNSIIQRLKQEDFFSLAKRKYNLAEK
jgi:ABC-type nitrate/sulfonate/bicarbonate transport system substrate-binding protein